VSDDLTDDVSPAPGPGTSADEPAAPAEPTTSAEPTTPADNRHLVRIVYSVAAVVIVLDQVTKFLAVKYLEGKPAVDVIGSWVRLYFLRNPGAAFSIGISYTWVFAAIAIAVVIVVVRTSRKLGSLWWAVAFGGLLGGATGNLLDRLFREPGILRGHVVDFIDVPHFAVFNLADSAIVCSAVLMVALALFGVELEGRK
jgi:signal peptidase II